MQRCSATRTVEIEDLRKKNEILEEQSKLIIIIINYVILLVINASTCVGTS